MQQTPWQTCIYFVSLLLLGFFTFSPCLSGQFLNWDDDEYVVGRWEISQGLTQEGTVWAFTTFAAANWHPVVWISYMAEISLFDLSSSAMHAVNLLLHGANVVLVIVLFRGLVGSIHLALVIGALFAVHPQHVEVVAWVSERKELLSTFFGLLSMISWCRFRKLGKPKHAVAAVLFFTLSLMSKQMLVTMPCLLVLIDLIPLDGSPARVNLASLTMSLKRSLPFFAMSASACVLVLAAQKSGGAIASTQALPVWVRLLNAMESVCFYLWQTVFPFNLSPFYCHPGTRISVSLALFCGTVIVAVTIYVFKQKEHPKVLIGWIWFLLTLLPVIGFVHVGAAARADRYLYFPHIGLFLMVVSLPIPRMMQSRKFMHAGLALALIAFSFISFKECQKWQNSTALWKSAVRVDPQNYRAWGNLASAFLMDGHPNDAFLAARKALTFPENLQIGEVYLTLGTAALQIGMTDEAISNLKKATEFSSENAIAFTNLGCAIRQQNPDEARLLFEKAVQLNPYSIECLTNLANCEARDGNVDKAIALYRRAIKVAPHDQRLRQNLSIVLNL